VPDEPGSKDEPVLTTHIDGEEVRLLVHIERIEEAGPDVEHLPAKPE
jgi:hypothetical protein